MAMTLEGPFRRRRARRSAAWALLLPNDMRWAMVAGILALAGRAVPAAYLVELNPGDRMTVDSYWVDGDRMHLVRGGVDLIVPRARVRSLHQVEGSSEPPPSGRGVSISPPSSSREASRQELEAREAKMARHLLRVQQERFEARARGESADHLDHLDKEFRRVQQRRIDALGALDHPEPAK